MTAADDARAEYLALLEAAEGAHLATLGEAAAPESSYAPCVWHDGDCYLFLSALSSHTGNLKRDPRIGLMLLGDAGDAANAFARKRAALNGKVEIVDRNQALFGEVLTLFHRRFGDIVQILEALPDFVLFRVRLNSGSFVRGFGQAYALGGPKLDRLQHIDPGK